MQVFSVLRTYVYKRVIAQLKQCENSATTKFNRNLRDTMLYTRENYNIHNIIQETQERYKKASEKSHTQSTVVTRV